MRPSDPDPRKGSLVRRVHLRTQCRRPCSAGRGRATPASRSPACGDSARPASRRQVLLTFVAIGRAKDCILALSDRMEGVARSDPSEVTKCCLSDAVDFYMALAGDAEMVKGLLGEQRLRQPSGADIFREVDRLAAKLYLSHQEGNVAGHLIVADGDEFKVYGFTIVSGIMAYHQYTSGMVAEGDAGAVALCERLARDIPMSDMPCETAARCLHTMASYIAETVESAGGGDEYGFDMVVFSNSGTMTQLWRRTDRVGSIRARFEPSGTGPPFSPDEVG